jgi:hypothetical protein
VSSRTVGTPKLSKRSATCGFSKISIISNYQKSSSVRPSRRLGQPCADNRSHPSAQRSAPRARESTGHRCGFGCRLCACVTVALEVLKLAAASRLGGDGTRFFMTVLRRRRRRKSALGLLIKLLSFPTDLADGGAYVEAL